MSKVHCIICDRKDPLMYYVRLPRNKITVPVCPMCVDKYDLYNIEPTCLRDLLEPAINIGTTKNVNKTINMLVDDILTEIDLDINKVPSSDDFMQGTIKGLIRAADLINKQSKKYIKDIRKHLKDNEDCGECQECVHGVPKNEEQYFCAFHGMNMNKSNTCEDYIERLKMEGH